MGAVKVTIGLSVLAALSACCGRRGPGSQTSGTLMADQGDGVGSNVDFGNVLVGRASGQRPLTITNQGAAPLHLEPAAITGSASGDFQLTTPFPATIPAGGRASASAVFRPRAGGARSATVAVPSDGVDGTVDIQLSGNGIDIEICSAPAALDFGPVQVQGTPAAQTITVTNCGKSPATFSTTTISGPQAGDFSVAAAATTLQAGQGVDLQVSYSPAAPGPSSGSLGWQACDPSGDCAPGTDALSGVGIDGALTFAPDPVAFGNVPVGNTSSQTVTATNTGTEAISLTELGTYSGSSGVFTIQRAPSLPVAIAAGSSATFAVQYRPSGGADTDQLVGVYTVSDPAVRPRESLDPLTGNVSSAPCSLAIAPTSLNFGNVPPGIATTYAVTLTNQSADTACQVSGVALAPGSDATFSLPASQATSVSVTPGGSIKLQVTADPPSASPPLLKRGTLTFATNGTPAAASIPLSAFVNSACIQATTQAIYTVDEDGTFCSFDPTTLTFSVIGTLSCPSVGSPFSMGVDQNAVAWVLYDTGEIFKVDTSNASCSSTSFAPGQDGLRTFGMSFMTDATTGADSLYVAGGSGMAAAPTTLATIAFPSLALSPVGSVALGWPELTGTGDGQLWGYFPAVLSTTGHSLLAQLDPTSGAQLGTIPLPQLDSVGDQNFALKFYGGSFWLFLGTSVYEIQRSNGAFSTPMPNSGHAVVGAGDSTCVPVQ